MTDEIKKDPMENVVLTFSFTVGQMNNLLNLLGNAPLPYVATAPFIMEINKQGEPQFRAAIERLEKAKDEPETTA